jgi:hypothetical protein
LYRWYEVQQKLAEVKDEEAKLRKEVFGLYFPTPVEGTNTAPLPEGWVLKGVYKINRKVDEEELLNVSKKKGMAEVIKNTINYKPSLSLTEYKNLPDNTRKILDNALIATPGTPSLEVALPKRKNKNFPHMPGK